MTTLYIMIIGPGSHNHSWSHLPQANDVQYTKTLLGSAGVNLRVIVIQTALSNPIPESMTKDYPSEIEIPEYPLRKYNRTVITGNTVREIRRASLPVMFLDYTGTKTSYDLMEILETATTANRWYLNLNPGSAIELNRLVAEWMHPQNFDTDSRLLYPTYDIYSGERLNGNFRGGFGGAEFKEILSRLILMCRVVENYLRSGFHENQILSVPEPWTLNLHTYALAGLIRAYKLYPKATDKDINYEIATNPQYRYVMTQALVHVLGAFTINNGLMSRSDVAENGGWYSWRLMPKIRLILEKWIKSDSYMT